MTEARPAVVSLEGLTRHFGQNVALDGLTLSVRCRGALRDRGPRRGRENHHPPDAGRGPSPTGGQGVIHGVDVAEDPEGVKPFIAYMSQQFGLYQDLTVRENIDFYADLYRVPKGERPARLDRLFAFSNLGPFQDRLAGNLSGGMKQKLSLCCALIHHPKVLLLDEPTFGVDPISRRDLWLILHEMVEEGVTVLVSTSYLDEAERCDRVVLLHEGRVLALDTPQALLDLLPGEVVSVEGPEPTEDPGPAPGHPGVVSTALFGNSVHAVLAEGVEAAQGGWGRLWRPAGFPSPKRGPVEPSLEDVFLHLVRERKEAEGTGCLRPSRSRI